MRSTASTKEDTITLDATGQTLGELAVQIAHLLQGKDRTDFVPHQNKGHNVVVENIDKISFSARKLAGKLYWHYTGYPGGIYAKTLEDTWQQNPQKVLRHAVNGMLPKNKLRNIRLLKLEIR